jgi:co-chaperonin GroES (HSP10)
MTLPNDWRQTQMSDIDILATKREAKIAEEAEKKAKQLPEPKGYRLLCMVPKIEEEYASGLIKADETKKVEEQTTVILFVAKMGDMAYSDKDRFPTGPWCKEGDFVLVRPYSGTRLKLYGTEWRVINDDMVEAVVEDPRGLSRA